MKENTKKGISNNVGKTLPSNVEAEDAIMTILFNVPNLISVTQNFITDKMFYKSENAKVYEIMCILYKNNGTFDNVMIQSYSKTIYDDSYIYISRLIGEPFSTVNLERYCLLVLESYLKRETYNILANYSNKVFDNSDIADIYDGIKYDLEVLFNITNKDIEKLVAYEESLINCCIKDESSLNYIISKIDVSMFYKDINKEIYSAINVLNSNNVHICLDSVIDYLSSKNNNVAISELKSIMTKKTSNDYVYYCNYIVNNNNVKALNKIAMSIIANKYNNMDSLVNNISEIIDSINSKDVVSTSVSSALSKNIRNIRKSKVEPAYLKTNNSVLNEVAFLCPNDLVVIAGTAGCGKTRLLIHLMKSILELNNNISVQWFSMEDPDDKIMRAFISGDISLTDSQMLSKDYNLSDSEIKLIENASNKYKNYDIEFINEPSSINTITAKYKSFVKKRPNKHCILIVDNFMLITEVASAITNNTQVEDMVSGKFTQLRIATNKDGYKSTLFVLHHLTKEVAMKANKAEGYRPRLSMVKGSTRIIDASTVSILINNIGQHKDLIKEAEKKPGIKCVDSSGNVNSYKRATIMKSLVIFEVAKNRNGEINDDKGLSRYICDFGKMKFTNLKVVK